MPSGTQPESGPFARAVSAEIRSAMARQRMSGAELARKTDRSQGYINKRLRDEVAFTANDIEDICDALGVDLMALIHAAVRASVAARNGHRQPRI
jgi:transcriptional regulator with XRE-family HTH domain